MGARFEVEFEVRPVSSTEEWKLLKEVVHAWNQADAMRKMEWLAKQRGLEYRDIKNVTRVKAKR